MMIDVQLRNMLSKLQDDYSYAQDKQLVAAIHPMHKIFDNSKTKAILLADAEIAFNTIDRKVLPYNTKYLEEKN